MEKAKTVVLIAGKEYTLSGYESEEYMHRVAIYVDRTMREITKAHGNLPTNMVAVLAALNIADELLRARGDTGSVPPPESAAALQAPGTAVRPDAGEAADAPDAGLGERAADTPDAGLGERAADAPDAGWRERAADAPDAGWQEGAGEAAPEAARTAAGAGSQAGPGRADAALPDPPADEGHAQGGDPMGAGWRARPGAEQAQTAGTAAVHPAHGMDAAGRPAQERPYAGALTEDADTHRGDDIPDPEPFPIKPLRDQEQTPWRHRRF